MIRIDKDAVLERNNIVDVIGSYIPLKKRGQNYIALCPFHKEKTGSFTVSESKGLFKCFGCGKGGNVITFVMEYEKVNYGEALKILAKRSGISYTDVKTNKRTENLYKIYEIANNFYKESLKNFGDIATTYLNKRKIGSETIAKFEIGYAMDSFSALKNHLIKNDISQNILLSTGLFSEKNGNIYDIFRNRLMIPIHSKTGKIVAFGGRLLDNNAKVAKYINSPTTKIYNKGMELYGFYKTKRDVIEANHIIIVEGYLDFLRLYEEGITNIAASLGTSLTDEQIDLAGRYVKNFIILYDGDNAGRKASLKAAMSIIKKGFDVKIVLLPLQEDPDSYILKYGKGKMKKLLQKPINLIDFINTDSLNINQSERIAMLLETADGISDLIKQEMFIKSISEQFKISEKSLMSKISKKTFRSTATISHKENYEERDLISYILQDKSYYKKVAQEIDSSYFFSIKLKNLYHKIGELYINADDIISEMDKFNEDERNLISGLMLNEKDIPFERLINSIKMKRLKYHLLILDKEMKQKGITKELLTKRKHIIIQLNEMNKKGQIVTKTMY